MNVTFRPLPRWPYEQQPTRPDLFKATYSNTLDLLEREIGLREALKQHHPDHGGDPWRFADVQAYRQLSGGGL